MLLPRNFRDLTFPLYWQPARTVLIPVDNPSCCPALIFDVLFHLLPPILPARRDVCYLLADLIQKFRSPSGPQRKVPLTCYSSPHWPCASAVYSPLQP